MASSAKFISFLLVITLASMEIHGRESQFFSKVSSNTNNDQKLPEKEMVPDKVDLVSTNEKQYKQEQQEPKFLPENQNGGYGLYGHETGSGELPSSTTTTTTTNLPYKKAESEEYNNYRNTNNNNYDYNRNSFNGEFDNSRFSQSGYDNQKAYFNGGKDNYNTERQGMSDTRFLENGKYFYDINSEYNPNSNQYENTKNEVQTNWNRNNNGGYYSQNNQKAYGYRNSMGGYQNNEEQFQNEQNEFEP